MHKLVATSLNNMDIARERVSLRVCVCVRIEPKHTQTKSNPFTIDIEQHLMLNLFWKHAIFSMPHAP
jgi:hypothetical protein